MREAKQENIVSAELCSTNNEGKYLSFITAPHFIHEKKKQMNLFLGFNESFKKKKKKITTNYDFGCPHGKSKKTKQTSLTPLLNVFFLEKGKSIEIQIGKKVKEMPTPI